MQTIWKYPLAAVDQQALRLPAGAQILDVQVQDEAPVLWALVETERPDEGRTVEIVGTGQPVEPAPDGYRRSHLGTFQLHGGVLVFHVFEVRRDPHDGSEVLEDLRHEL